MSKLEFLKLKLNNGVMNAFKHRNKIALGLVVTLGLAEIIVDADPKGAIQQMSEAKSVKEAGLTAFDWIMVSVYCVAGTGTCLGAWAARKGGVEAMAVPTGIGGFAIAVLNMLHAGIKSLT